MQILKICEYCTKEFIARKTTTKCCSDDCAKRFYKLKKRNDKISQAELKTEIRRQPNAFITEEEIKAIQAKDYLTGVVAEALLYLRNGAFVMLTKNHPDKLYVNGTLGYIEDLLMDKIIVRGEDGKQFEVLPEKWCQSKWIKTKYGLLWKWEEIILGTMHQFPIKLAFAITINKSQGLTFENVSFNNNVKPFSAGQVYVALSRSRIFEGLKLSHKLNKNDIKVDKNVLRFYKTIQKEKRLPVILDEVNKEINDEIIATDSPE